MDNSKNRLNDHLGVNKIGKNIKKSPLHQPNFANNAARQQPQPQVYNISKNDFRNVVQQLTGSPLHDDPLPRPPQNSPKPQSMRLQRIRPPPLTPINRPRIPPPIPAPARAPAPSHAPALVPPPVSYNAGFVRPGQYGQPLPTMLQPGDALWANTAESPISAYMRYLQTSLIDPSPVGNQGHPQLHPPVPAQPNAPPPSSGLLPNPPMPAIPSPRGVNGPPMMPNLPSPRMNGPVPPMPNIPSPRMNGPGLLPSPTSQFLLPSPSGYMNLLPPRSPYGLLSPGVQFPPLSPNFTFSPLTQPGSLGPGPQPPPSPGLMFPLSPGFFPYPSPRWRDQ